MLKIVEQLKIDILSGHPFFDQVSSIFLSHLFKLLSQHTVTEILNIWVRLVRFFWGDIKICLSLLF